MSTSPQSRAYQDGLAAHADHDSLNENPYGDPDGWSDWAEGWKASYLARNGRTWDDYIATMTAPLDQPTLSP